MLHIRAKKLQPLAGEISLAKHLIAIKLKIGVFNPKYTGIM